MTEFLEDLTLLPLVLTIGCYQFALWLQKKLKTPICNPIVVSTVLVIGILLLTGTSPQTYQAGMAGFQWLMTPATVCLALPLYEQFKILRKNLPAILTGVAAGTAVSLLLIFFACRLFHLDSQITVSLLPKSITSAMGMILSEQNGGLASLTVPAIVFSGILGNLSGSFLCRLLNISHPIAQGVAFGTASHVIGTSRAVQIDPLAGAVSSMSLAAAGVLTTVLFPLFL